MKYDTIEEITELVYATLEELAQAGYQLNLTVNRPHVRWNERRVKIHASANYLQNRITISRKTWPEMDEQERHEIIVHETCHLVTKDSHGKDFKAAMACMGLKGRATTDRPKGMGFKTRARNVLGECGCGNHYVTRRMSQHIRHGIDYQCRGCKSIIRLK